MSDPKAPAGLQAAGKALWRDLTGRYELMPGEAALLEQACRTADELARLEAELRGAQMTVAGSAGQLRPHPVLAELRGHRAVLAALMKQLVPAPAAAHGSASEWGSMAARARWHRDGPRVA